MLALSVLALVHGARVAVIGASNTIFLGVCFVHATLFSVAGVTRAWIIVVAIGRRSAHAFLFTALVRGGALVTVVAQILVAREEASAGRIALVIRAGVVIITELQSSAHAFTCRAFVHRGAGIAVIAGCAFQLLVLARAVGVARIRGAWVAVIAEAFIRLSIAVVIQAVALFWLGRNDARGESVCGAGSRALAGARGCRVVAHGGQPELLCSVVALAKRALCGHTLVDGNAIYYYRLALIEHGAGGATHTGNAAELALGAAVKAFVDDAFNPVAVRVLCAWVAQPSIPRETEVEGVSTCPCRLFAVVPLFTISYACLGADLSVLVGYAEPGEALGVLRARRAKLTG